MEIPILYEDGEALVLGKPAGLPVDRPRKPGPALADQLHLFRLGFQRSPLPVHRLDTDTSGCLLLARNPRAHKRLAAAFEARLVEKVYCGILAGMPPGEAGTITLPLAKVSSPEAGWRIVVDERGKPAISHWRLLQALPGGLALVEFRPETGRTHQLRVHALAGLGHVLLGDPVYGTRDPRARRTMLHASKLVVQRAGKTPIAAHAPLPADFLALGAAEPEGHAPAD